MARSRLVASGMAMLSLWGCNALLGIEDVGDVGGGGGANAGNAGSAAGGGGGTGATSGGAGVGGGGGQGSGGEAPAAPCEASEAPDEKAGVFVDPRLGDDANEGTIVRPFQTVERAANEAAARGLSKIYLAPGSYQEALSLRVAAEQAPGVVSAPEGTAFSFEGGWTIAGTRWQRDCAPDARENTVLASPSTTGVSIRGAFGPIAFRNLAIATVTAAPPAVENEPGASCYGVNASGAALRLRFENVEIDACPGGPGGPVTAVTPPPDPPTCGFLADPAQCSDASPGADAAGAGAPAPAGAFTDEGYAAGLGEAGPPGEQGKAGLVGPGVAAPRVCSTSDSTCCITTTERQQGRCGCGGFGGPGGLGGRGGGASIAIFVRGPNATLDLAFATLRARDGGAGEVGKDGEPGLGGGLGAAYGGFGGFGCCDPVPDPNLCECTGLTNCVTLPAQPPGGPGGPGGKGGRGGGGSGGPSFGIVRVGQVEVTQRQSVINVGRPGAGVEGAPAGEAGPQKEVSPSVPSSMPPP